MAEHTKNTVYILQCADSSYYTGWTNRLKQRIVAHQNGKGAKYTKPRRPVRVVYTEVCATKEEAMRREYQIKQLTRAQKDALIRNHSGNGALRMNPTFDKIGFLPADILLPQKEHISKWGVVACDQYTSEPEYWREVEQFVNGAPSTLRLIFPEVYLQKDGFETRIAAINKTMHDYLAGGVLEEYPDSFVYVRRTQADGKIRKGLVGKIDLEQYDFSKESQSPIRATEGTILDRLPPRVQIRQNAALETPHIMVLVDDPDFTVIEPLDQKRANYPLLYETDLMKNGGHIAGYRVAEKDHAAIANALAHLADPQVFAEKYNDPQKGVLLFAVGDGNHSLATAWQCYLNLKEEIGEEAARQSPARYALVELVNLHDAALEFEAIHRVVFDVDPQMLLIDLVEQFDIAVDSQEEGQSFDCVYQGKQHTVTIKEPTAQLTVGTLQAFLDGYIARRGGTVDYIHGRDVTARLAAEPGRVGFLLPDMKKEDLYPTVVLDGSLPRKTFSMGNAWDKRYYFECRAIRK